MIRSGRALHSFPFTAIHLLDAAAYFAGCAYAEAVPTLEHDQGCWRVSGRMLNGAECELIFEPDTMGNTEFLVFEGDETWEMHFPNAAARHPGIWLTNGLRDYPLVGRDASPAETMGFAPGFRNFLGLLENGGIEDSPHRLASCQQAVALMEEMLIQGLPYRED